MALLLGFDTGGTYTDAVLFEPERGVVASAKALTTKHDLSVGLGHALNAVMRGSPGDVALVSVSTTLATNAIVERHGSPICLLLLGYDRESLDRSGLRRAMGEDPVVFIAGGHLPTGDEQAPLDLAAARAAILRHAPRVAAFAVSGFFSVRNPAHERAVRDLVRALTDRPVTCGHELTSRLDAPRRALTAALNARLIPQLARLVRAVKALLESQGIRAPLMVVKGDGSLIGAEAALERPVETILSGPAASVVGARYLSGLSDVFVADMGGTTTDIALLEEGRPVLSPDGALVGGWRTMVEAVAVHTYGLGGDSELRFDEDGLAVGPRRAVPLSLLALQHPPVLAVLREEWERAAEPHDGQFALRQRPLETGEEGLTSAETQVWQALGQGPRPLARLQTGYAAARALDRLVDRGLVVLAGMTPSDAAHVLGRQQGWSVEAARLGAELFRRREPGSAGGEDAGVEAFCGRVIDQVVKQAGRALASAALAGAGPVADAVPLGWELIDRALGERPAPLLGLSLHLDRPLIAIGAPVATYYPEVARRLHTELLIPPHAAVSNAVGAVVGSVVHKVVATVTAPEEGRFRVHLPDGIRDFPSLDAAAEFAVAETTAKAGREAEREGAVGVEVLHRREDRAVRDKGGREVFIETVVTAVASGRPRLAAP